MKWSRLHNHYDAQVDENKARTIMHDINQVEWLAISYRLEDAGLDQ